MLLSVNVGKHAERIMSSVWTWNTWYGLQWVHVWTGYELAYIASQNAPHFGTTCYTNNLYTILLWDNFFSNPSTPCVCVSLTFLSPGIQSSKVLPVLCPTIGQHPYLNVCTHPNHSNESFISFLLLFLSMHPFEWASFCVNLQWTGKCLVNFKINDHILADERDDFESLFTCTDELVSQPQAEFLKSPLFGQYHGCSPVWQCALWNKYQLLRLM